MFDWVLALQDILPLRNTAGEKRDKGDLQLLSVGASVAVSRMGSSLSLDSHWAAVVAFGQANLASGSLNSYSISIALHPANSNRLYAIVRGVTTAHWPGDCFITPT